MKAERYGIRASSTLLEFEFISEGIKGKIVKVVQFSPTEIPHIYNLGFGDRDILTGKISDLIVSGNGDSQIVLQTVAGIVFDFLTRHALSQIIAVGSTPSRNRYFQIAISNNLETINNKLEIYGRTSGHWEKFNKLSNYDAFMVRLKR